VKIVAAIVGATAIAGALSLCGCARDAGHGVPAAAQPAAVTAAAATAPAGKPAPAASPAASDSVPSYEVAIASAQADRVRALNGCDDKQGAPRVACIRAADKEYDEVREAAEKIRGSGGR
jgi:hypothetical protein